MTKVKIFSDGAARGNPDGPGGYGSIIQYIDGDGTLHEREFSEGFNPTTNNRMELLGAIVALENLTTPCDVELTSDSAYLINAFQKNWIGSWQKNGWKTASKAPVKNKDLWLRLLAAAKPHSIHWNWVKGHAGHPENERCDQLATKAADAMSGVQKPNVDSDITATANEVKPKESHAMKLRFKKLNALAKTPTRGSAQAAGYDLYAANEQPVILPAHGTAMIPTGLSVEIPDGYFGAIVPRSGLATKQGIILKNLTGVIDSDYRGEVKICLYGLDDEDRVIESGERIAQFIVLPYLQVEFEEADDLSTTDRGVGGFGSTGSK